MKKSLGRVYSLVALFVLAVTAILCFYFSRNAYGLTLNDDGKIKQGVKAGSIDLSGMTGEQAEAAIEKYVASLSDKVITLNAMGDNSISVSVGEMGLYWANKEIVEEATELGRQGNIVKRYKDMADLKREGKVYDVITGIDESKIESIVNERCMDFNQEAIDATLERVDGSFKVTPGQDGLVVNAKESASKIASYIESDWSGEDASIELAVSVDEPKGKTEELEQVKDIIGSFTTSFKTSASGRSANVRNGCSHINGSLLYPGDQLSVYEKVSPFTEENGYYLAGSYNNGLVVETLGGGICQVSSTLYNAVIRAELQVDERSNHSMVVTYVDVSGDAAISGTSKDFKFTNSLDYPIYIEGYTTDDKKITFNIYGKETRPENRTIEFESEIISETVPEGEKIVGDSSQPIGYTTSQSAHTGYTAKYWKIVKVDGKEIERTQLNSSNYMAVPKTVTYGTAGDATGAMAAAIATQDSAYCGAVSAELVNAANAANILAAQQAAEAVVAEAVD